MSSLLEVIRKVHRVLLNLVHAKNLINFLLFSLTPIWFHFKVQRNMQSELFLLTTLLNMLIYIILN